MNLFEYADKSEGRPMQKWEHYFPIYEELFSSYRNRPLKILEIGVWQGGSLEMWKQFFHPGTHFVGVDIYKPIKKLQMTNVTIEIGDQANKDFLKRLGDTYGPFDIIMDDGGHRMKEQIVTFEELYKYVKDDGLFFVEDVHTSYVDSFTKGEPITFIQYAKNLVDHLYAWYKTNPVGLLCTKETEKVTDLTRTIQKIGFYDSIVVFHKCAPKTIPRAKIYGDPKHPGIIR